MKYLIILLLFLCCIPDTFCQRTECNVNVYTGFFYYRGNGATSNSVINYGIFYAPAGTSNVYGTRPGFSFSAEGQATRITAANWLYGAGLSYDQLESKVNIYKVQNNPELVIIGQTYLYDAEGNTGLKNRYITIHPFAGKRFITGHFKLDVYGGIAVALCLSSMEQGSAGITGSNDMIKVHNSYNHPNIDVRPAIQLRAGYKRAGILIGYLYGVTNYSDASKVYSNFLRIGVGYTLR